MLCRAQRHVQPARLGRYLACSGITQTANLDRGCIDHAAQSWRLLEWLVLDFWLAISRSILFDRNENASGPSCAGHACRTKSDRTFFLEVQTNFRAGVCSRDHDRRMLLKQIIQYVVQTDSGLNAILHEVGRTDKRALLER